MAAAMCMALAACGGAPSDSSSEEVQLSGLPDLPGCSATMGEQPHGLLTALPLANSSGLYVIYDGKKPLCIDTLSDASRSFGGANLAASNPMPGQTGGGAGSNGSNAGSNPMPGQVHSQNGVVVIGGSNPMPGH
jgi:hypothetical protein